MTEPVAMLYDAFIAHATEDKDEFVRPLAHSLAEKRAAVWFDEFSLVVGDSLRRSIDLGLTRSRFGIVVLSPSFFSKEWPQWELDGLVARQNASGGNVILPVWHNVTKDDVLRYSPSLADKIGARSTDGLEAVVTQLLQAIHPRGSTLVFARDYLLDQGLDVPVVTDDWWLDLVAFSDSNPVEHTFQSSSGWGRWGFPLPPKSKDPDDHGWRLAVAGMQRRWRDDADARPITQITRPEQVHAFIAQHPLLAATCHDHLHYLVSYAPQLTIRGFGGEFESEIETVYRRDRRRSMRARAQGSRFGSGLTTDDRAPKVGEDLALRDPAFGNYRPSGVACGYVQGSNVINGPQVSYYEKVEYIAWLLSDESRWLPDPIRDFLIRGMAEWAVWTWHEHDGALASFGFKPAPSTGALSAALFAARAYETFRFTSTARADLDHRMSFSTDLLKLPESGQTLARRFIEAGFVEAFYSSREDRAKRQKRPAPRRMPSMAVKARVRAARQ